MKVDIRQGDSWAHLKTLPDNSIGSLVTDPPYLIDFMGRDWDSENSPAGDKEFWKLVLQKMKHGAHGVVFGHSRQHHRVMVALEDAGFEIRDTMMWMYGQGFPKNHNVGKAVDKLQGNDRKVVGQGQHTNIHSFGKPDAYTGTDTKPDITVGTSQWEGWGTALKPAYEPIILVRKPLEKKLSVAKNVMKHGVGAINIDASRVSYEKDSDNPATNPLYRAENDYKKPQDNGKTTSENTGFTNSQNPVEPQGRFPANVLISHHPECKETGLTTETYQVNVLEGGASHFGQQKQPDYKGHKVEVQTKTYECHEDCPVSELDRQAPKAGNGHKAKSKVSGYGKFGGGTQTYEGAGEKLDGAGGASRFFHQPKWTCHDDCPIKTLDQQAPNAGSAFSATRKKDTTGGSGASWVKAGGNVEGEDNGYYDLPAGASRFFYQPKISTKERNWGCDGLPTKQTKGGGGTNGKVATAYGSVKAPAKNHHPTVKPVALMKYLVSLITPAGETVLDPFMGSGSTGMACVLTDNDFIGFDLSQEYCDIAQHRINYVINNKAKVAKEIK